MPLLPTLPASRRRRRAGRLAAHAPAAVALMGLLVAPAIVRAAPERFELRGDKQAVFDLAGQVAVVAGRGEATVVEVDRHGADGDRLQVRTSEIRGAQTLCVLYPSRRIVYPAIGRDNRTQLKVRSDGTFGENHSPGIFGAETVTIDGSGDGLEAHADLRVEVPAGQTLTVHLATGDVRVTNVDAHLGIDVASADVKAAGVHGALAIDAGNGDADVRDVVGPLAIDTGSGNVTVTDVRGGNLAIDTGSGDVVTRGVEADHVAVDTGSGDVTIGDARTRRVAVDTGSGAVNVDLLATVDELSIDTGSGSARVAVPRDIGASFTLQSGNGDFDVDLPMTHMHRDDGELSGVVGDGRGHVVIQTGSGSIAVHGR